MGLANIDQPLFHRSIKPGAEVTAATGYIRLHGRKTVAHKARETYAVTNNHHLGKAVVNALEIASILKSTPVEAPESLLERYPELREFMVET